MKKWKKKLENKNINLSGWGFSFSGLAFAFYAQGSGFSPQRHEKKDFGTCQHSEGRGRTEFKANHIFLLGGRLDREEKGKLNTYFISKTPGTFYFKGSAY